MKKVLLLFTSLFVLLTTSSHTHAGDLAKGLKDVMGMSDAIAVVNIRRVEASKTIDNWGIRYRATIMADASSVIGGDAVRGSLRVAFGYANGFKASHIIYRSGIEEGMISHNRYIFLLCRDETGRNYRLLRAEKMDKLGEIKRLLAQGVKLRKKTDDTDREKTSPDIDTIRKAAEKHFKKRGSAEIIDIKTVFSPYFSKIVPGTRVYAIRRRNPVAVIAGPPEVVSTALQRDGDVTILDGNPDVHKYLSALKRPCRTKEDALTMAYATAELSGFRLSTTHDPGTTASPAEWAVVLARIENAWQVNYTIDVSPRAAITRGYRRMCITIGEKGEISIKQVGRMGFIPGYR